MGSVRLASVLLFALTLSIVPLSLPFGPLGWGVHLPLPVDAASRLVVLVEGAAGGALLPGAHPDGGGSGGAVFAESVFGDAVTGGLMPGEAVSQSLPPRDAATPPLLTDVLRLKSGDLFAPGAASLEDAGPRGSVPVGAVPETHMWDRGGLKDALENSRRDGGASGGSTSEDFWVASPPPREFMHLRSGDLSHALPASLPQPEIQTATPAPETGGLGVKTVGPGSHTVVWGDNLWQISRMAGVSVATLAAANHICEEATLHPGQVLTLPAPGSSIPETSPDPASCRTTSPVQVSSPHPQAEPHTDLTSPEHPTLGSQGDMVWPSYGAVTSRFGWRIHPIFGTREFHTGVDIGTRWGAPVVAARTGIVRFVGWKAGYGRLIVVDHGNGLETDYSHLSAALVGAGERVVEGQVIGRVGNTGWSTGPHLLFEVRRDGVPLDPFRYLR